ncbi:MAG: DinB family protein [Acidobacteriota bacterium]|nr:DinB family protein [Acidobacteriota bacterium]
MATILSEGLKRVVAEESRKLHEISEAESATRRAGGDGWSCKQELGHLLDSATNNRARFTVAALEGRYTGATYDGTGWADLGGYADTPWTELLELWERVNFSLATLVEQIPDERLQAPCKIGDREPVTLEFLIDDYILHLQHHLDHILAREHLTNYPGAAVGV